MNILLNAVKDDEGFEFWLDLPVIPRIGDKIILDIDTYDDYAKENLGETDTFTVDDINYFMIKNSLKTVFISAKQYEY